MASFGNVTSKGKWLFFAVLFQVIVIFGHRFVYFLIFKWYLVQLGIGTSFGCFEEGSAAGLSCLIVAEYFPSFFDPGRVRLVAANTGAGLSVGQNKG